MDESNSSNQAAAALPSCIKLTCTDIDLGTRYSGTSFTNEDLSITNSCSESYIISLHPKDDTPWINSIGLDGDLESGKSTVVSISGKIPERPSDQPQFSASLTLKAWPGGIQSSITIHGVAKMMPQPPPPLPPKLDINPHKIELGEAIAGTRFTRRLTINNIGGGSLIGTIETDKDWIIVNPNALRVDPNALDAPEADLRKLVFTDIKPQTEQIFDIYFYTPPTNEHFPGRIVITSINGGNVEIKITGTVLRELYWGTDTFTAVRVSKYETYDEEPLTHELRIPQNFYVGRLGHWFNDTPKLDNLGIYDAGKFNAEEDDVKGKAVFAYWYLNGPGQLDASWTGGSAIYGDKKNPQKLIDHGQKQAKDYFLKFLMDENREYKDKFHGNTLFVDVEHPIDKDLVIQYWGDFNILKEDGRLTKQQERNQIVFEAFLDTLDTEWKKAEPSANRQLGVYTSKAHFKEIMGDSYDIPHDVVLWIAHYPSLADKPDPHDPQKFDPLSEDFNIDEVVKLFDDRNFVEKIGRHYPVIWQFTGSGKDYFEDCNLTDIDPVYGFSPSLSPYRDISLNHWAINWINKAYENGIMTEYSQFPLRFGPDEPVLRQDAAVSVLKTRYGKDVVPPPATGTVFNDVPIDHPYASWIEKLKADGFASGRSTDPPLYYPVEKLTRAETAVLTVRLFRGTSFSPPKPSGTVFQDVPATHWATGWIEQLHRDGMAAGSSTNPPLFRPEDAVNRAEMAVFLMKTTEKKPGCGALLQPIVRLASELLRNQGRPRPNRT